MLIKAVVELKEDIAFLKEILQKAESNNMHDHLEAIQMLRDEITHMQERSDEYANKSGG